MQTETTVEPEVATDEGKVVFAKGADIEIRATGNPPKTYPTEFRAAPKYPPTPRLRGTYRYGQILPHEVWAFAECVKGFCHILRPDFTDLDHANLMKAIHNEMASNPYSVFIGCVDEAGKPQGHMWIRIEPDVYRNDPYVDVVHDYVVPEIRDSLAGARVHRGLLAHALEIMNRCNCKYIKIRVPNKRLFDSRKKLGFEAQSTNMIFRGTAQEFRERNPMFKNKGSEVENDG